MRATSAAIDPIEDRIQKAVASLDNIEYEMGWSKSQGCWYMAFDFNRVLGLVRNGLSEAQEALELHRRQKKKSYQV